MTRMKHPFINSIRLLLILSFALGFFGCASSSSNAPPASQATLQKDANSMPTYYDFGDVMVPSELKLNRKESFVYATGGTTAGVLTLKGRVDRDSLIAFFENNMVKDNWRLISSFRAPKAVMLFQKESRWCIISIEEDFMSELVKIWVAPTINAPAMGMR